MRLLLHGRGCGRTTISCKSHMRWHRVLGTFCPPLGVLLLQKEERRGLPRFKKGYPFRPWLMRILYRQALDVMEKQGTYLRPLSLDDALASADPVGSERHLEQVDPQERVAERETVRQALTQLSAEQRRVIALRYGADLTEVDIAQVLGWPVGTVKSRLNRARERLRELLKDGER